MDSTEKLPLKLKNDPSDKSTIKTKRADNIKIVVLPGEGRVYVCPYPPTHLKELEEEARRVLEGNKEVTKKFDR